MSNRARSCFKVEAFRSLDTFKQEVTDFAKYLKSTKPQKGVKEVLYPGEVEWMKEQVRRKEGIEVDEPTWKKYQELAKKFGIETKIAL